MLNSKFFITFVTACLFLPTTMLAQTGENEMRRLKMKRDKIAASASSGEIPIVRAARATPRIVGGRPVVENDRAEVWKFTASLQDSNGHFCGASLVSPILEDNGIGGYRFVEWDAKDGKPRMAITAAHCVFDNSGQLSAPDPLVVRSGSTNLNSIGGVLQKVREIVPHPGFSDFLDNDIAVLLLEPSLGGTSVSTLAMPSIRGASTYFQVNAALSVNGWGRTGEGGAPSARLNTVRVPFSDQNYCRKQHELIGENIQKDGFCAGFRTGGFDGCSGDSGGGLYYQHTSTSGTHTGDPVLVGVVSWGIGCARYGLQGVYTSVLRHLDWIEAVAARHGKLIVDP
jgi:trypsin